MIRLAVRCRTELADVVLAELVELAPNGVEEEHGAGYVEYAIYGPPGELPDMPQIRAAAGEGLVEVSSTEIPDDWADRWRDFHQAVRVGRLCVRPSWVEPDPQDEIDVCIDPGQAFGTGGHATTAMCLELLSALADSGAAAGGLCDLGTGSGVLAIAAAKLGWHPVSGFDHERPALEAAAENAAANGVEIELERVNLRTALPPLAATCVANLTAPLLHEVAARLPAAGPPELLVCSGMLLSEVDGVSAALGDAGFEERARRSGGEWSALLVARAGGER
jgi:ribosomal protein L11 methyltransferase